MRIIYSYNKRGWEADYWQREISAASTSDIQFIPFNHEPYQSPSTYVRAQLLDNLYYQRNDGLMRMYDDVRNLIRTHRADVLLVDNCPPYHPEFLRTLDIYRVLRICDGPTAAYDRDFAYVHAYDHMLYHSPAYSRDLTMPEKLAYCGAKRTTFWPLALFDALCDPTLTEEQVFSHERDLDVIFVGALYVDKMPLLGAVKKAFGRRFKIYGLANWKRNAYFNAKYGFPGWVKPIAFDQYVPLYLRSKIGINSHLRGKYTVGSYRMFDLPGNGVMQITDGSEFVKDFYVPGKEAQTYEDHDELIAKIDYYLTHPAEREALAREGYRRVMNGHRIGQRLRQLRDVLAPALGR